MQFIRSIDLFFLFVSIVKKAVKILNELNDMAEN